jgi:hypothetical protein
MYQKKKFRVQQIGKGAQEILGEKAEKAQSMVMVVHTLL